MVVFDVVDIEILLLKFVMIILVKFRNFLIVVEFDRFFYSDIFI